MKDTSSFLDLALDDSMGFDPLGAFDNDVDDDAEEVTEGYLGTPHTDDPTPVVDTRPASERIADLFSAMAPRRRTLLGMIAFCAAPQTTDALDAEVDRLQADNFSVYSPASLANLLERAGALARVTADGEPYPEGDPEPVLVEVDGVSYYEAGEAPEVCWLATADGAAYAEADKPLDRLTDLLAEDAKYATIYERILGLTAQDSRRLDADHQRGRGQRRAAEEPSSVRAPLHRQAGEMRRRGMARQELAHYRGRPRGTAHRG